VDVSGLLQSEVYAKVRGVVFTSATLTVDGSFDFFKREHGLLQVGGDRIAEEVIPSPFAYDRNVLLGIPTHVPTFRYNNPSGVLQWEVEVSKAIVAYSLAFNGRTLVLFTNTAAMGRCFDLCREGLEQFDITALLQEGTSLEQIEEFERNEYSVLFGVDRFWSGVDFPGPTLSQVIITKLPNPSLADPVLLHRRGYEESFWEGTYASLAKLRLRQGFGRLMRHERDVGAVVILDKRILESRFAPYLRNLPVGEPYVSSDRMVVLDRALVKAGLTPEYRDRRIDVWLEADRAIGRSLLVRPGAQGVSGVYAAEGARV
jgi:ATP-dependent DNA helicase DinG